MEKSQDLDQIVRELNDASEAKKRELGESLQLDRWLEKLVADGGSDLLLVPGAPASMLFEGGVRRMEATALDGAEIEEIVVPALSSRALTQFRDHQISDSSYRIEGLGRFRINLHRERGQAGGFDSCAAAEGTESCRAKAASCCGSVVAFTAWARVDRWSSGLGEIDDTRRDRE